VLFAYIKKEEKEIEVKFILPIVEEAYHQELNALEKWDKKADNVTKYISIYLVLFNILFSFLKITAEQNKVSFVFTKSDYFLTLAPAIIALAFAVFGQAFSRIGFLPNAKQLITVFMDKPEKYSTEEDIIKFRLLTYDKLIKILKWNNLFKGICVLISYLGYFVSLIILAVQIYNSL
jgi:hypothetical protein